MAEENVEPKPKRPIARYLIAVAVVVAAIFGVRHFLWAQNHESTDNAQVAGDVVIVSPQVTGTVKEILVADNALVKEGQPLIKLDAARFEASVQQAKANLEAALADAQAAGVSVEYAMASTRASETQSGGGLSEAESEVGVARTSVEANQATVKGAESQSSAADADVESSKLDAKAAQESVARSKAAVSSALSQAEWAKSAAAQADSNVEAAMAGAELADRNLRRTQALFEEGAESRQRLDSDQAAAQTAKAALQSARSARQMAVANVSQKAAELESAQAALAQAKTLAMQAEVRFGASAKRAQSARANVDLARLQVRAAQAKVQSASARRTSSEGQVLAAKALRLNVTKLEAGQKQALAKVQQAKAALEAAELDLKHAVVYAPCDGRLSKRLVDVGSLAQVGGALVYVVPSGGLYILANFKETQVAHMSSGQKVEFDVDGIPGKTFHGTLDSLSAATGASFALLPPDNSTGNFVKVVQRVPVKIRLSPEESSNEKLRVGMSVVVTVQTR